LEVEKARWKSGTRIEVVCDFPHSYTISKCGINPEKVEFGKTVMLIWGRYFRAEF
jgi:hypothetical protein